MGIVLRDMQPRFILDQDMTWSAVPRARYEVRRRYAGVVKSVLSHRLLAEKQIGCKKQGHSYASLGRKNLTSSEAHE